MRDSLDPGLHPGFNSRDLAVEVDCVVSTFFDVEVMRSSNRATSVLTVSFTPAIFSPSWETSSLKRLVMALSSSARASASSLMAAVMAADPPRSWRSNRDEIDLDPFA